ncbi:hypothetical protein OSTOST_22627 [Ostertagia ostertagi]
MESAMSTSCPEMLKTALSSEDIRTALTYGISSRCAELMNRAISVEDIRTALEHFDISTNPHELLKTALSSEDIRTAMEYGTKACNSSLPVSDFYDVLLKTAHNLESLSSELMSSCEDTQIPSEAA